MHNLPYYLFFNRAGAVGINLTQANSVFLMEPCLNPALEAQAIGRVHRLGQKREVEIVRLIMKDSVESRLLTLLEKKYGDSKDLKDDSEDSPTKPTSKKPLVVGNVCTDRTTILTEEFDLLFDMESQPAADDDSEIKAEPVGSSGFV
jgi:superfamily II DNA or RNA helicase